MHAPQFASFSRRRLAVVAGSLAASLASACSGTSTGMSVPPSMTVSPATTVSPSPAAASSPLTITQSADGYAPSAGPKTAFVLYAGQFFDYTHLDAYAIATQGSSGAAVPVTWSLSGPAISPSSPPMPPNASFQTAPPNGIELTGSSFGKSTLTATTSSQTASIPVYYFPSVFYGCAFRASGPASFDPDPQPSRDPLAEDAYVTMPVDPSDVSDPCAKSAYATAQGTPIVFHFPYGATIVTDGNDPARPVAAGATRGPAFQDVQATAYRDDFTSISSTALEASLQPCGNATTTCATIDGSILLFKTMAGRVVKLSITEIDGNDALLGPYEVTTTAGGAFPY